MLRLCIIVLCFPPRNMYIVKTIVTALLSWIVGHFINQAGKQNTSEAQVTDFVWWVWNNELAKSLWGGRSLDWNKSFAKPRYFYLKSKKKCASPTIWTLKIYNKKKLCRPFQQGGRSWQPFGEGKNGQKNFRQSSIYFFCDKCIVFARNYKFANLTQYNLQYLPIMHFLPKKHCFWPKIALFLLREFPKSA